MRPLHLGDAIGICRKRDIGNFERIRACKQPRYVTDCVSKSLPCRSACSHGHLHGGVPFLAFSCATFSKFGPSPMQTSSSLLTSKGFPLPHWVGGAVKDAWAGKSQIESWALWKTEQQLRTFRLQWPQWYKSISQRVTWRSAE